MLYEQMASGASIKETQGGRMFSQQKHCTVKPLEFDLFCGMDVDTVLNGWLAS